jgi:hypothetical protein
LGAGIAGLRSGRPWQAKKEEACRHPHETKAQAAVGLARMEQGAAESGIFMVKFAHNIWKGVSGGDTTIDRTDQPSIATV